MGKMKANRKFIKEEKAVSAVIGVILMVAITVAIAATVYVYVSGMIGTSPQVTPTMTMQQSATDKTLTVIKADPNSLTWAQLEIKSSLGGTWLKAGTVKAGNMVTACKGTMTIRHISTNTLIGTWTFT
jgi:flagellin-like protein